MCLTAVAELEECPDGEGCIPEPAVAVVPVAHPPDRLGQGCGWRGDDRARGRVGQELQGQSTPKDSLLFGPWLVTGGGPGFPDSLGRAFVFIKVRQNGWAC